MREKIGREGRKMIKKKAPGASGEQVGNRGKMLDRRGMTKRECCKVAPPTKNMRNSKIKRI